MVEPKKRRKCKPIDKILAALGAVTTFNIMKRVNIKSQGEVPDVAFENAR
jgi:hypothetical protein